MYVILEDANGKPIKEVWVLIGSEVHFTGKLTYRRTGRLDGTKPIFKQV